MAIAHAIGDTEENDPQHKGGQTGKGLTRKKWVPYWLLAPGMIWLGIFFVIPIVSLFFTSLQTPVPGGEIGQYELTWRFANYWDVLSNSSFYIPLIRAFAYALIATIIALLIAYPLAYVMAFKAGKYRNFLLVLVIAPFFVSFILRTVAWRQILSDDGPVTAVFRALGLMSANGSIYPSAGAVIAGIVYNFLPFMTLPIYASLERLDNRLVEASSDLYAGPFT
ncbi:MAG: ABC transporter permease, partial [Candidatus Nanopelagicales bacterium]